MGSRQFTKTNATQFGMYKGNMACPSQAAPPSEIRKNTQSTDTFLAGSGFVKGSKRRVRESEWVKAGGSKYECLGKQMGYGWLADLVGRRAAVGVRKGGI